MAACLFTWQLRFLSVILLKIVQKNQRLGYVTLTNTINYYQWFTQDDDS
jgi:hypothetical protein